MVQVLHTLTCEKCNYTEESCDENFGIDDILDFTAQCDNCSGSEHCQKCIIECSKCNNQYCDYCIEGHDCNIEDSD